MTIKRSFSFDSENVSEYEYSTDHKLILQTDMHIVIGVNGRIILKLILDRSKITLV
jgi:hypothetical protein